MKVYVTFEVDAESPTHAVHKVERYLAGKGVHKAGEVEVTLDRTEPRDGYYEITTE